MLEVAEHAATGGDFASADELLRGAARIQEAELGPLHPDLANTLNNLAIVAEKMGRPGDAETFYRRATAIASASLPADHPMVADSRQNLEDFCRARGLADRCSRHQRPLRRTQSPDGTPSLPRTRQVRPRRPFVCGFRCRLQARRLMPRSSGRPSPDPRRATSTAFQLMPPALVESVALARVAGDRCGRPRGCRVRCAATVVAARNVDTGTDGSADGAAGR